MWYYTTDGTSQGPVDDAGLDQLLAGGTITTSTLVWKEGLTEWKPLRDVRAVTGATPLVAGDGACTMCGKNVGVDNLVDLLGRRVCAACKPMALQTLREGAPLASNDTAWSDGKKVVCHDQMALPTRCFKCNQSGVEPPIKRKLYWHPAVYYWLIVLGVIVRVGILIYVITAVIVRKKVTVDVYLCDQHRQRRIYFIIGAWTGVALGLVLLTVGASINMVWLSIGGALLAIVTAMVGLRGARFVRATLVKDGKVWLKGAGPEFLASLPPLS